MIRKSLLLAGVMALALTGAAAAQTEEEKPDPVVQACMGKGGEAVEARLNAAPAATTPAAPIPSAPAAGTARHVGEGKVESITKDAMTFSHGPIPTMKWGAMTMEFKLPPGGTPGNLKPGDRASFEFFIDADDLPQLTRVTPMAVGSTASAAADPKAPPVATPAAPATPGSKP